MNIIIAPSAFKHSLPAHLVANAIQHGLVRSGLSATYHTCPIADGGNGTLDAFLANGGTRHTADVNDPLGRPIRADWGILPDGETAVIEMALASGIELIRPEERNPLITTTFGTGQLMQHAIQHPIKRLVIGMGGSATVDGGAGCLQALGVRLLDTNGQNMGYGGENLHRVARIEVSDLNPRWHEIEVFIATDVQNPTLGTEGASAVFAPQKGATPDQVIQLETGLTHFFTCVHDQLGVDVRMVRGGGAAGALSAGILAMIGGKIISGIDLILEYCGFYHHLKTADLVITGEGLLDSQTAYGKAPIGIARVAREAGVPVVALVGGITADDEQLHQAGISAILPIIPYPMPLETALEHASHYIMQTALRLGYLLQLSGGQA